MSEQVETYMRYGDTDSALVYATMALVEEQRTANLIAFAGLKSNLALETKAEEEAARRLGLRQAVQE